MPLFLHIRVRSSLANDTHLGFTTLLDMTFHHVLHFAHRWQRRKPRVSTIRFLQIYVRFWVVYWQEHGLVYHTYRHSVWNRTNALRRYIMDDFFYLELWRSWQPRPSGYSRGLGCGHNMRGRAVVIGLECVSDAERDAVQPALGEGFIQHIGCLVHDLLGLHQIRDEQSIGRESTRLWYSPRYWRKRLKYKDAMESVC